MMRDEHIGNVVIVDERDGRKVSIGIVTNRDIVVQLVAKEVDPDHITVIDLMARESCSLHSKKKIFTMPFSACAIAARGGFRSLI
jgi:hypothetical protein